jgi:hypothetical protein
MTNNTLPWKSLYPIAAWAALLLLAYSLATMISLALFGGMPESAQAGFDLLAENRIVVAFFLPAAGAALMFVAGPLYLAWFPLLARDFFRMEKEKTQ